MTSIKNIIINGIAKRFPELNIKLIQAGMRTTSQKFVARTLLTSLYMTAFFLTFSVLVFSEMKYFKLFIAIISPFFYLFCFLYFMQLPVAKQRLIERKIEREIVYASRFLIIELQSGVSLYDSFNNIVQNYKNTGKIFKRIVQSVDLGSRMEDAIDDSIETCPSNNLRKILIQIKNSLQSGADVTSSMIEINHQITKEQIISVKEYGRKLNPFVMFFMMIGVIVPSLGATAFIVFSSFLKLGIDLTILLISVGALGFIQFMFLNIIKSQRPPVDI